MQKHSCTGNRISKPDQKGSIHRDNRGGKTPEIVDVQGIGCLHTVGSALSITSRRAGKAPCACSEFGEKSMWPSCGVTTSSSLAFLDPLHCMHACTLWLAGWPAGRLLLKRAPAPTWRSEPPPLPCRPTTTTKCIKALFTNKKCIKAL